MITASSKRHDDVHNAIFWRKNVQLFYSMIVFERKTFLLKSFLTSQQTERGWVVTNYWYSRRFMGLPVINIYAFTLPDI